MQVNTGALQSLETMPLTEIMELRKQGFEEVPEELSHAAKCKLNGKRKAMVSLTSGGKLSRWASSRRKKKNQRAKASRRRNRHS